jgi:ABC-type sugar transport system substrate-binding protein
MGRFSIAALAVVPLTLALVLVAESREAAQPSKITICHKTGSVSNPWTRITVSGRAVTNQN